MRWGVVVFPGSNCDQDAVGALSCLGEEVVTLWHEDEDLAGMDCVVLPGGFSYGDYLRAGAMAARSPVMGAVRRHAAAGGLVLGICNGFQILCEAGLLPGAFLPNENLRFVCRTVQVRVETNRPAFTRDLEPGTVLSIPIAHAEGNYRVDPQTLERLERAQQVVLRYCDATGEPTGEANPNGSVANIAGVANPEGNVLGMMPHPERAVEQVLGSTDGRGIFRSAAVCWAARGA
ncbi:MAG: phosphoribosylformylglycinamidine synthase subunit PurQ [Thermaerobacter sp.]|jgi:phosphoribosylformylglycinamidine synthase|nr:phosphoribosylformylglycinamidine synthase subunit PurQ [Thermaerobacter sp.]